MLKIKNRIKVRQNFIPNDVLLNGINSNIKSGSLWSGVDVGFATLLSFVRSVILARILYPADFGKIAIATVFTQFILIFANFGFSASVIYYRNINKDDISSCWFGNIVVDTFAVLLCIVISLFSEKYIQSPEISIIIIILSVQFLITSIGSINLSLLQRTFCFKIVTFIKIFSSLFGFLCIIIFLKVFKIGIFSIVWGGIVDATISTFLYIYYLPWLPTFKNIRIENLKKHLKYGGWLLGVNTVNYLNGNLDTITIGTFLNNTLMGYYDYASRFPFMIVTQFGQILNRVLFSAFSNVQNDLVELKNIVIKLVKYNSLLIYPVLVGLILVSEEFVIIFYGDKWLPIIYPMKLLCVYGLIKIFTNPYFALANGIGKTKSPFIWTTIALPINLIILFFSVKYWGLNGVIYGKFFFPIFTIFTLGTELYKVINIPFYEIIKNSFSSIVCCTFMSVIVFFIKKIIYIYYDISIYSLSIIIFSGMITYVLSLYLIWPNDLKIILGLIKRKPNKVVF